MTNQNGCVCISVHIQFGGLRCKNTKLRSKCEIVYAYTSVPYVDTTNINTNRKQNRFIRIVVRHFAEIPRQMTNLQMDDGFVTLMILQFTKQCQEYTNMTVSFECSQIQSNYSTLPICFSLCAYCSIGQPNSTITKRHNPSNKPMPVFFGDKTKRLAVVPLNFECEFNVHAQPYAIIAQHLSIRTMQYGLTHNRESPLIWTPSNISILLRLFLLL